MASSMTGLASSRAQSSLTTRSAATSSGASTWRRNALPARIQRCRRSRAPAEPLIVAPWGSEMPGLSCTSTSTSKFAIGFAGPSAVGPGPVSKTEPAKTLVSLYVTLSRRGGYISRERWGRRLLVPTGRLEPVPQRLLIERRRHCGGLPLVSRPKARRVRREDLIADGELTIDEAELELRVRDYDPAVGCLGGSAAVRLEANFPSGGSQLVTDQIGGLIEGNVLVVAGSRPSSKG